MVLVGLRGSGKSSVGRELARLLGLPFFDTDAWIESDRGLAPAEILETEGEESFRRAERRAVDHLSREPRGVLALGGGAAGCAANRRALEGWRAVLLDASDNVLLQRLRAPGAPRRPSLTGLPLPDEIARLRRERWPDYLSLDPIRIQTDGLSPRDAAHRVLEAAATGECP